MWVSWKAMSQKLGILYFSGNFPLLDFFRTCLRSSRVISLHSCSFRASYSLLSFLIQGAWELWVLLSDHIFSQKERISSSDGALFILICDLPIVSNCFCCYLCRNEIVFHIILTLQLLLELFVLFFLRQLEFHLILCLVHSFWDLEIFILLLFRTF